MASIDDLQAEYYIHLGVTDEPGVLSAVAGVFATHGVSISSMSQQGSTRQADLVFITHRAQERAVRATLAELGELSVVRHVGSVVRVLGEEPGNGSGEGASAS